LGGFEVGHLGLKALIMREGIEVVLRARECARGVVVEVGGSLEAEGAF